MESSSDAVAVTSGDAVIATDMSQRTFPSWLPRRAKYALFYRRFPMSSYFPTGEDDAL